MTSQAHGDGTLQPPQGAALLADGALPADARLAAVASRYHSDIVQRLLDGAAQAARERGVALDVLRAPGALELPLLAREAAASGRYAAVVALACVIRGGTVHFEHVGETAHRGLLEAGLATGVPIGMAVLTVENVEQAWARAGGDDGNKGYDAASAALDSAAALAGLRSANPRRR